MLAALPSPAHNGVHIGPLFVHAYGVAYIVGLLAAIAIAGRRWEARGGNRELVHQVALWGFPAGLVGGRLYFLATSWNEVPHHWWGPFAIWHGGLGIWGGIAGGTLAGVHVLRRRGADIPAFLDAAAPGLLVAQAIGRVGNYFNQELFGGPTNLPWALQIDPAHRPAGYAQYATFHPTFLYELIWNLALAGLLVWLGRRGRIRAPGLFALYVAGYSGFRIVEELLRVDPAHHILGLRLHFYVATLLLATGLIWFARIQRSGRRARRLAARGPAALGLAWIVCSMLGCGSHAPRTDLAWGDADPASDFLPIRDSYLPYRGATTDQRQLERLLRVARARGHPFKVAVIATPADLGAVTSLFNRPQPYAKFLYQEIAGFLNGPAATLVVVMPAGVGVQGHDAAAGRKAAAAIRPDPNVAPARLTDTAIATVENVAAAAGHPLPHIKLSTPPAPAAPAPGQGVLVWLAVAGAVLGGTGLVLTGRALRRALTR